MTNREAQILDLLTFVWMKPRQFGAKHQTDHAKVASRMVAKGWVEREAVKSTATIRKVWMYRLTEKGATALRNHRALSVLGGRIIEARQRPR